MYLHYYYYKKKERLKFIHVRDMWGDNVDKIFVVNSEVSFAIDYKQYVYEWGGDGVEC